MFERIFPAPNALKYHQFFDVKVVFMLHYNLLLFLPKQRYYNLLLQEWVRFYHKHPSKGDITACLYVPCSSKVLI